MENNQNSIFELIEKFKDAAVETAADSFNRGYELGMKHGLILARERREDEQN